jgi:hypothetical protein
MNMRVVGALILLFLLPADDASAAPSLAMAPIGFRIESVTPVPGIPRTYDVVARAGIYNTGDPATNVTAQLTSSSAQMVIADGDVSFGAVGRVTRLNPVTSIDTFKVRLTYPRPHTLAEALQFVRTTIESLSWRISCGNCGGNRPPVANAGAAQTTHIGQSVALDGSASTDPDGDSLRFTWSVASAPPGAAPHFSDASSVRPTTALTVPGTYVIQLIVNDGHVNSAPSLVTLTTVNSTPVANAGPDQAAVVGAHVALNGAASNDVDGDALTYEWRLLEQPATSSASLLNADPASPSADFVVDRAGRYVAQLTVRDAQSASSPDAVVVSTVNSAPIARAGVDRTTRVGEWVELSGAGSSDADQDALAYRWSLTAPPGSATVLSSLTGATTGFAPDVRGVYVVQLVVNDGSVDSEADTVAISTVNSRPTSDAGANREVSAGSRVDLNGGGSSDPDGDALSFAWSLISAPPDSGAALVGAETPTPYFVADVPGLFVAQLVVSDGNFDSVPSTTQVSVLVTDDEPPYVTIETPALQSFVNSRSVRFRGQVSEAALLSIGGIAVMLDSQNRFDQVIELAEGWNFLEVVAEDSVGNRATDHWVVTVDTQAPQAPRALALTREVLSGGILRVSGDSEAVEMYAVVRVTNLRTGQSVDAMSDGNGRFEARIAGLESDDLSIVVRDAATNESPAVQMPGIGGGELRIEIATPLDGVTVADRLITVRGQLFGPLDAGVSINNLPTTPLESGGTRTFVAAIALQPGENLIEIVAARPNGARVIRQLHVTSAGARAFSVTASPGSGVAPLNVMFEISQFEPGEIRRTTIDLDGNGTADIARDNDDRFISGSYPVAGIYEARVVIETATGEIINSTVPITVLDRATVDVEVQRVWSALRAAFLAGDAEAALALFEPDAAQRYRPAFTAPGTNLAALAPDLGPIFPAKVYGSIAEYVITRSTAGVKEGFIISFMRTKDGAWRLSTL